MNAKKLLPREWEAKRALIAYARGKLKGTAATAAQFAANIHNRTLEIAADDSINEANHLRPKIDSVETNSSLLHEEIQIMRKILIELEALTT